MLEVISFPSVEIDSIKKQLRERGFCTTTRVAEEFYRIKQFGTYSNKQGLGKLYVFKTHIYDNLKDHSYYKWIIKNKNQYNTITKFMKKSENQFKVVWFRYA